MKTVGCIIIQNEKAQYLCVSRKDNHTDFGLPGGKSEDIDNGDVRLTAVRETFEETGILCDIEDLTLVYTREDNGFMAHTYLATKYQGTINHNEPHIVKWGTAYDLINGSFGDYNKQALINAKVEPFMFLHWKLVDNSIRLKTYRLDDEPELIHIIQTGFDNQYIIVFENAYEDNVHGTSKISTKEEIKSLYNIEL